MYPKIYLAIDNCFASKRWTQPKEWARTIAELGVQYIECSADTELDPLYMGPDYMRDWPALVKAAQKEYGVKVCNLYSGHGTYSTLGLGHNDYRVREHLMENWFKPLIRIAGELDAGMGFFAHCFSVDTLMDGKKYTKHYDVLIDELVALNRYGAEVGCKYLAIEQMYSPNQIPWTIFGTHLMMRQVSQHSKLPFYFTEDVGHHSRKYVKPTRKEIIDHFERRDRSIWLGGTEASELFERALAQETLSEETLQQILEQMGHTPWLFSTEEDTDCYEWLRRLGCFSPIIHLQQTDGNSSPHLPFTQNGIIEAEKVLRALKESYDNPQYMGMPERCEEIYLTLEIFSGTAQTAKEILDNYRTSVAYWRKFIPNDGITLDKLVAALESASNISE